MASLLATISVLAQGEDLDSWVNIVFIAVLAIASVIGGLVKSAKGKKARDAAKPQSRPGPRPQPAQRPRPTRQAPTLPQARSTPAARTQQPPPAPGARLRPAASPATPARPYPHTPTAPRRSPMPVQRPAPAAKPLVSSGPIRLDDLPDSDLQLRPSAVGRRRSPRPAILAAQPTLAAQLLRDAGPEDLKTAILYTEILGKPLSLRDRTADLLALQ